MPLITCPSCNTETSSEYNFCTICDKQVKCLNLACNKLLVQGKTFCFSCGQSVNAVAIQIQPNRYVRRVQDGKYEEYTEFNVSDHAVTELAPFIVGQMNVRSQQRTTPTKNVTNTFQENAAENHLLDVHTEDTQPPSETQTTNVTNENETSKYFTADGEFLVSLHKDFKGTTWSEQQKRFIVLYTWAYKKIFAKAVPNRENFTTAAQKASIYDKVNFSRYLDAILKKDVSETSNGYILNTDGETELKKILGEIENENIKEGKKYWERSSSTVTKRETLSAEDKKIIESWASESVELGRLDIRTITTPKDYSLLALWIITVSLKKAQTVRRMDAYYYLKEKFPTITVSSQSFSRAMSNPNFDNLMKGSDDDKYYLTPDGQKLVESWINSSTT